MWRKYRENVKSESNGENIGGNIEMASIMAAAAVMKANGEINESWQ